MVDENGAASVGATRRYSAWTLRRVLLLLSVVFTIGIIANQMWTAGSFRTLALSVLTGTTEETLRVLVQERISQQYEGKLGKLMSEWVRRPEFTKPAQEKDVKALAVLTDEVYSHADFTQRVFTHVSVNFLSDQMETLVQSERGSGESVLNIPGVRDQLLARDKQAQRQVVSFQWTTEDGRPLHSMIAPLGGFRVIGFMELITDPVNALDGLNKAMVGDFILYDVNGAELFAQPLEPVEDTAPEVTAETDTTKSGTDKTGGTEEAEAAVPVDEENKLTTRVTLSDTFGEPWAHAAITRDMHVFNDAVAETRNRAVLVLVVGVVVAWAVGWIVLNTVTFRPQRRFADAMDRIGEGNTDVVIPETGRDEMAIMATALEKLRMGLVELKGMQELEKERDQARRQEIQDRLQQMSGRLDEELRSTVTGIQENMQRLETIAGEMATSAADAEERSQTVADAARQATDSAEAVVEETGQIAGSFRDVLDLAGRSGSVAAQASSEVDLASQSVTALAEDARRISAVITLINEIADQTNMLALNATIEAARAGDAGKGFAVVATEVKNLANRTTQATEEITTQINRVQSRTKATVDAIQTISDTISQMSEMAETISHTVEARTEGTRQITGNVRDAAAATRGVTEDIGEVTKRSAQVGELSQQVRIGAREVSQGIDTLRDRLSKILN